MLIMRLVNVLKDAPLMICLLITPPVFVFKNAHNNPTTSAMIEFAIIFVLTQDGMLKIKPDNVCNTVHLVPMQIKLNADVWTSVLVCNMPILSQTLTLSKGFAYIYVLKISMVTGELTILTI